MWDRLGCGVYCGSVGNVVQTDSDNWDGMEIRRCGNKMWLGLVRKCGIEQDENIHVSAARTILGMRWVQNMLIKI